MSGQCTSCSTLTSQLSSCYSSDSTTTNEQSCLQQTCSQQFFNELAVCTTCYSATAAEISSESTSIDSIISSCGILGLGGNLCNPLAAGSSCAIAAAASTTNANNYNTNSYTKNSSPTGTNQSLSNNSSNGGSSSSSPNIGVIAGGVVGGVVVIAAVAFLGYRLARRKPRPQETKVEVEPYVNPAYGPPNPGSYSVPIQNIQYNNQPPQPYGYPQPTQYYQYENQQPPMYSNPSNYTTPLLTATNTGKDNDVIISSPSLSTSSAYGPGSTNTGPTATAPSDTTSDVMRYNYPGAGDYDGNRMAPNVYDQSHIKPDEKPY